MSAISEEMLVSALSVTTRLIEAYGDAYWPIFDRLEQELLVIRDRECRLKKYSSAKIHTLGSSPSNTIMEIQNDKTTGAPLYTKYTQQNSINRQYSDNGKGSTKTHQLHRCD